MKLDELSKRIKVVRKSSGYFHVIILYRKKKYHCFCSNSSAYDRINVDDDISAKKKLYGLTLFQAYKYFYDVCKYYKYRF